MSGRINTSRGIAYLLSAVPGALTAGNQTSTATGAITALAITGSVLRMNNATDATIHGIAAGVDGQLLVIQSIGAGNVLLMSQSATETEATNRLQNFFDAGATPLAAGKGTAIYQYDATTARWRIIAHEQGDWISITFAAGDYTGNASMTWTVASGDVAANRYFIRGATMRWAVRVATSTVGGTPNTSLQVAPPSGYTLASYGVSPLALVTDNGTSQVGRVLYTNSVMTFRSTVASANWTASTDLTNVEGELSFRLS